MNEYRFYSLLKDKIDRQGEGEQLKQIALAYAQVDYAWGRESLHGADCSGLICGPLLFLGYDIRTTAHGLMTKVCDLGNHGYDRKEVDLIFFLDEDERAKHVGIVVSDDVIYHQSGARGATFNSVEDLVAEYAKRGMTPLYGRLNWDKVEKNKGDKSGVDEEFI